LSFSTCLSYESKEIVKERSNIILQTSGITCLQKHLDVNHQIIFKKFQEEINKQGKKNVERQLAKKRSNISNSSISKFFVSKYPFKKDDVE
jgi:hypothetical protein